MGQSFAGLEKSTGFTRTIAAARIDSWHSQIRAWRSNGRGCSFAERASFHPANQTRSPGRAAAASNGR